MFVGARYVLIVRETYETRQKNVKSRDFWDFEKNVKRRSDNIYAYSPEDHDDQPQSVLLSFAQYQAIIIF